MPVWIWCGPQLAYRGRSNWHPRKGAEDVSPTERSGAGYEALWRERQSQRVEVLRENLGCQASALLAPNIDPGKPTEMGQETLMRVQAEDLSGNAAEQAGGVRCRWRPCRHMEVMQGHPAFIIDASMGSPMRLEKRAMR